MLAETVRCAPGQRAEDLAPAVREALSSSNLVHVVGVSVNDLRAFYTELCDALGGAFFSGEESDSGKRSGERWIEIAFDPAFPNRYRHAPVGQPLHTDYAYTQNNPPLALMFCAKPARAGGETIFVEGEDVVRSLEQHDPQLLAELREREVCFSKAGRKKVQAVVSSSAGVAQLNWLYTCVDPSNSAENKDMAARFSTFVEEHLERSESVFELRLAAGEAAIWKDERILHGRRAYVANEKNDRVLWKTGIHLERG